MCVCVCVYVCVYVCVCVYVYVCVCVFFLLVWKYFFFNFVEIFFNWMISYEYHPRNNFLSIHRPRPTLQEIIIASFYFSVLITVAPLLIQEFHKSYKMMII